MENFDPEMLFQPSKEKLEAREQILNETIVSLGIGDGESIVHFGCGSRDKSFLKSIKDMNCNYLGIDADGKVIEECSSLGLNPNFDFKQTTIQSFIDDDETNKLEFDWCILDGILNKNLYEDLQYEFVDTIIRKSLGLCKKGVVITFNTKHTKYDDSYNADFLMAYLGSMYNRFSLIRLNDSEYLFCVYKYYI